MKLNKLLTLSLLCLLLTAGSAWGQNLPVYQDIEGHYAQNEILALSELGIVPEAKENFFPQEAITRADFTMWLAKAAGILPVYPAHTGFNDLDSQSEAYGYIAALAQTGIVAGDSSGNFKPQASLTRQDGAVILYNLISQTDTQLKPSYQVTYLDQAEIAAYAQEAINQITYLGILKGNENYFAPRQTITRGQAAVITYKIYVWSERWAVRQEQPNYSELSGTQGQILELNQSKSGLNFSQSFASNQAKMLEIYGLNPRLSGVGSSLLTINQAGKNQSVALNSTASPSFKAQTSKSLTYSYQVAAWSPDNYFAKTEYETYPGAVDGLASAGESWIGYLRQEGRDITVDLGSIQNADSLAMEFQQDIASGIRLPAYVNVEVSVDGEIWYHLGRINHNTPDSGTAQVVNLSLSFPSMSARYFKISFPVEIYTFIRHLTISGGQAVVEPTILPHYAASAPSNKNYLNLPAMQDILLLYSGSDGYSENPIVWNQTEMQKLVGYVDSSGQIKDTMFDSMLFLPAYGALSNKASWYAYLEDLFKPDQQLAALNQAVGEVNQVLGLSDSFPVILTLPYPDPTLTEFGPWGLADDPASFAPTASTSSDQAYENRLRALRVYYKQMLADWEAAAYSNLNLAGIYWYKEDVDNSVYREAELVQSVARMVKNDGYDLFWIPYYGSAGYDNWQSYGFSYAILQPNYFSATKPGEGRMEAAAALSKSHHMGVEIELDDKITYNRYYYDLFYKQLEQGKELGLDGEVTNAYYASSRTLANVLNSQVDLVKGIYDDLYRWIKGNY